MKNKKHLKNVGPIRHNEPPHANSPDVASGTVARRLCINVHDDDENDDNAWQRDRYGPMEWAQWGTVLCVQCLQCWLAETKDIWPIISEDSFLELSEWKADIKLKVVLLLVLREVKVVLGSLISYQSVRFISHYNHKMQQKSEWLADTERQKKNLLLQLSIKIPIKHNRNIRWNKQMHS